jgi:CRP/FNR family transcriptional regulator
VPSTDPTASLREAALLETLRRSPLFAGVPPGALVRLVSGSSLVKVARGDHLFREAEPAAGFYIVHAGAINVHRVTADGREQVIRVFYPGESLGEVVLVGDRTYPASAKAIEDSLVILVRTAHFRECIREQPDLALAILASMSVHLRYLVETVESLKLDQAEARVAHWLLRQHAQLGLPAEGGAFEMPLGKALLASQLGVTPETLSRVFARLRREGAVDVDGPTVRFLSPALLRARVAG